jgi:D-3-phosphoglycerate dehydrogenase
MLQDNHIVYPDAEENLASVFSGERLARLESLGKFSIYYGGRPSTEEFIHRIGNANAVLSGWGFNNQVLGALSSVEIVSFVGLGVSTFIDLEKAAKQGITVTHTLSAAETIAEHTMALMLAAARNLVRLDRETRAGGWNTGLQGFDLRGKTLGLVGFGPVAQATLPLAQAFGMHVIVWTRNPDTERAARYGIKFHSLDDLLAESDLISFHLPVTPDTEGMITAERLGKTKPGVVIVNTARAQILDEGALVELLESGHVAAAGIDVFNQEPLARGHPFTRLENVVLTPHVAYNTPEASVAIIDMAIDNLEAFFNGKPVNVASHS